MPGLVGPIVQHLPRGRRHDLPVRPDIREDDKLASRTAGADLGGFQRAEALAEADLGVVVDVLVETGALGFAAMAAALILLAAGLIRAARRDGAPGATLLALSAAFWCVNLISYSFWSYWWQAAYVILVALVAAPLTPGVM